jgi:hypothetical protein
MTRKSRTRALAAAIVVTAAAALTTAGSANALTYCVAKPACAGTVSPDVQSALTTAAISPVPDRIEVGPGSFYASSGFSYTPVGPMNSLELVGAGRHQTELRGGSDVNKRPALLLDAAAPTKVSDLTIKSFTPADPTFTTAGLRIFGSAERIDVWGSPRSDGVELLKDSSLKSSTVSLAGRRNGVYSAAGSATVTNSSIDAHFDGTAAAADGAGSLTVSHSRLNGYTGVEATTGGAVEIDDSLVLTNEYGLFAYNKGQSPTAIRATNVTVVGTDPTTIGVHSAGVFNGSTTQITLTNSVIADVTQSLTRTGTGGGTGSVTARHSAYDHATVAENGPGSLDQTLANLDLTTPGFVDPAGGDYRLAADSLLLDAGDPAPAGGLSATDLAGKARSLDGNGDGVEAPDIGAFEFQPPAAPAPAPGPPPPGTPSGPADPPVAAPDVAPVITSASLARRRFTVGRASTSVAAGRARRGTTFRLTLSKAARVKIAIRHAHHLAGTIRRNSHAGANRIAFSGRIGRRALRPGRYVATITATDASGKPSAPRTLRFTVVKS